jgi:AbrB family looped-hinge helix DNA binding protein
MELPTAQLGRGSDEMAALPKGGARIYLTLGLPDGPALMTPSKKAATMVSTKGRVILPKAIREAKGWGPGTKLVIEQTRDGVLLRPASLFPPTKPENVFGCLSHHGKQLSDKDIEKALRAAAKRRYARD